VLCDVADSGHRRATTCLADRGRAFIPVFPCWQGEHRGPEGMGCLCRRCFRWSRSGQENRTSRLIVPGRLSSMRQGDGQAVPLALVGRKAVGHSKSRFLLWPLIQLNEGQTRGHTFAATWCSRSPTRGDKAICQRDNGTGERGFAVLKVWR